ncbi:MAG: VOC family protein [Proteobacteria bacterium]|nr:VOC family protein [Pseudomonadota bacterium]
MKEQCKNEPCKISSLTPIIVSKDANALIKSYEKCLNAAVMGIMSCPDSGKVMHSCLKIGDSTLFISDECAEMGINVTGRQEFYVQVPHADNAFKTAKGGGFSPQQDPTDMFWGDRIGKLKDRDGNTWALAQHVCDVSPDEMKEAMAKMGQKTNCKVA